MRLSQTCTLGYNDFDFENEEHKSFDGCKLKSMTHLQKTFFDLLNSFLRVLLQSFKKVLICMTLKNFVLKKI